MERPRTRRRWLALLVPTMAAAGVVLWLHMHRPLDHAVQGCLVADGGRVSALADRECLVHFEDGTLITLAKGTRGRIDALTYRRGASFAMDHGHVDLAVVHRPSARWDVLAGPFDVRVTGTRFSVDWAPSSQHFALRVSEGEVRVSGCSQRPDTSVRAGQGLDGDAARTCTDWEPRPSQAPASLPSVAKAPEPTRLAAPPQATLSRGERKRSGSTGRLAVRSPEIAPKQAPAPTAAPSLPHLTERDWSASSGLAPETKLGPRRLVVGSDGRLVGPEPGTLAAIGGAATKFKYTPGAVANNLYLENGALCTRGRIAALNCDDEKLPNARCDWKTNWGALIQWQPRNGQAWGSQAASSVALDYHGNAPGYRLVAHRQGDPDDLIYCVDFYQPGQRVTPSQFNLRCWEGGGTHLADFSKVDTFSLQVTSSEIAQRFRFCVSAIDLR